MKNLKKGIIALVIILIVIALGVTNVKAADQGNVRFSFTSGDKLVAGGTVTVNVNLDQTTVNGGVASTKGQLSFDSKVLEFDEENSKAKNGWKAVTYTPSTGKLGIERNDKTEKTGNIAILVFKVKKSISVNSTTISWSGNDVGAGEPIYNFSASVTIKGESTQNNPKDETPNPVPVPETTTNNNNRPKTDTKSENTPKTITQSKTSAKRILNAGDSTTVIISIVALTAVVGCISFIKYSRNKDIK